MNSLFNRNIMYFLRCAKVRSFKLAAVQIGVTQSSLSIAIKKLEEEIGAQLFERSAKGIRLTQKGQQLYQCLSLFQDQMNKEVVRAIESVRKTPLKIGARPIFLSKFLIPAISKIAIDSKIFVRSSVELYNAVAERRLDFAFIASPSEPRGNLVHIYIKREQAAWVCLRNKFPGISKARTLKDLVSYPIIHDPYGEDLKWASILDNHPAGFYTSDLHLLRNLIFSGKGIAEVELDLFSKKELDRLEVLDVMPEFPSGSTYLVYRQENEQELESILTLLRKTIELKIEELAIDL